MNDDTPAWYRLAFVTSLRWLQVTVEGTSGDAAQTAQWWRDISAELDRTGKRKVLVINQTHGGAVPPEQFNALADAIGACLPPDCWIAIVFEEMRQLVPAEHIAIRVAQHGHRAMMFHQRQEAETWLSYCSQ